MKYNIRTASGSLYVIRVDEDDRYWLSGQNVPNAYSEPIPGDVEWQIKPLPLPPTLGQRLDIWSFFYEMPGHAERLPGGGKITTPVVSVHVVEDSVGFVA
jgi:hypothetical protein